MIQRIQTVYLLCAAIIAGLMLAFPTGLFLADEQEFRLMAFGFESIDKPEAGYVVKTLPMGILIVMATILSLVTIFLFKNRLLQIRLCFAGIVIFGGIQLFVGYYLYHAWKSVEIFEYSTMKIAVACVFPVIGLILTILALRAISRDEVMVRSLNRIR